MASAKELSEVGQKQEMMARELLELAERREMVEKEKGS